MEAETITFAITYGKQNFTITMGKEKTLGDLKQEIYRVTGVEPAQQKLTGLVPAGHNLRKISDATPLGDGLVKGQKWRRPKQRMVMFGMPERVLSKQISEEQEALRKTQEIRESLEAADAHDKALEEESARIAAATKKAEDEAYRKIVEQHVKRVKTLEESLTSGFLGAPLPVHSGGSMPTQATRRINRGGEIETTQRESSQLTESGSGSDLGAKVETTLIAYSSVMAEDQNGLLDISAKGQHTYQLIH